MERGGEEGGEEGGIRESRLDWTYSTFRGATPPVSRDDGGRDGREKG